MMTEPKITSEQAAELAHWVGEMLPPKCSSAIHASCNRPAEYYVRLIHDCQGLPTKIWPVCGVVIRSLGQNVIDQRSFCAHCNASMAPEQFRTTAGRVPSSLEVDE